MYYVFMNTLARMREDNKLMEIVAEAGKIKGCEVKD